jgi:hypothetical protein
MISRGRFLVVIGAAVACCLLPGASVRAQSALEYSVKANYLVRFAAFVDWPAGAFADARSPVVICVLGRDPFGQGLDRAAASQTAYGRALTVRRPTTPEAAAACHILYIGQGGATMASALEAMPGRLTVTDAAVAPRRGMVHFVVSDNRVRFHIDQGAASRSRLTLSSRLLNLALSVQGR